MAVIWLTVNRQYTGRLAKIPAGLHKTGNFSKSNHSFGTAIIFPRSVMIQLSFGIIGMLQTLFLAEHGRFYDFSLDRHDDDFHEKLTIFNENF